MMQEGWVAFDTNYNRELFWSYAQQSRFIESLLIGLRPPSLYFQEIERGRWHIIDGWQRCCAIYNFFVANQLTLTNMEYLCEYNDKKYQDLNFATRRNLRMLPITMVVVEKGSPESVVDILVKRLNLSIVPYNAQEMLNVFYRGPILDAIKDMSRNRAFLEATNCSISSKRNKDTEFISRFTSFYLLDYCFYEGDMVSFVSNGMKALANADVQIIKNDFEKSMTLAKIIWGDKAFRKLQPGDVKMKPINIALFEVISVLLSKLNNNEIERLTNRKELFVERLSKEFKQNKSFNLSFSKDSTSRSSVITRFTVTSEILKSIIGND